ncbi:winged helix-turn-helix transcriptional regulator [Methanocorpusculum vombati]|uniref:Winged helix-turn-helix transcriptional regulator n=1 Tax=Methanocorpusculum vombati TaxID=3002864 RepID=A0ABT4IMI3_9EURY|nr:winged helix-turn-helix transcriptional regulator [Methanocorpusculum vombati]MCZ9320386.1 winged helix-turn-helix transcriptional regulator [Methanocorpusculum sp.]MCZ0862320.1 winged helix-turn-helix transcriptional regulator [Methanocorpusculum vombati]MDE2519834.1 winged helix-turn-helix transcriptional regulator [Methanocorpusculum sp.]MDE2535220.1 winged helix-turn-helix transcriptional regulator [Methanocorpusculum sp.]MDE2546443.1 winged helix-turn-helix transcriptional regulator [M
MTRHTPMQNHIGRYLLTGLLLSALLIGIVSADSSPQISISGVQVRDIAEDIIPIDDGKEILDVKGADALPFWRQILISRLSASSENTPLHDLVLIAAPFLFILLGCFYAARIYSEKQHIESSAARKIFAYIQENPGCSQKQLVAGLPLSRGSVCYHLHKLKTAGKLIQISRNGSTLYYPAGAAAGDQFEQTMFQLLTRKKSGKFLQVLYDHPYANRTELAGFLELSPETLRWYLRRYAREGIVSVEMVETECHYSFTPKARQVYEYLRAQNSRSPDISGQPDGSPCSDVR